MRIVKVNKDSIANILSDLLKRSPTNYGDFQDKVDAIIKNVRDNGDKAVFDYTAQFDKAEINADNILVTEEEIKEAYEEVDDELIKVIRKAIKNIRDFHEKQIQKSWFETREDGVMLGQKVTPMETCGVYVPGGKAVYPSSVLMNIVPAHVAGVKNIIMTTPPGKDGKVTANTLVAAKEAGATKVYKVGGAQAIAAMAFGTESIPKVDKIVGPGNIFVALAKKAVYGNVSIDSIAGPNHVLPTNGTAKFFSPLSVDDFIKKSSVIYYSREALEPVHKDIEFFANQEQLTAHANSMKVRFEDNQEG